MKTHSHLLLGLLLAVSSGIAHSEPAWFLLSRSTHVAIVVAQGQGVRDVAVIPGAASNYGESRRFVTIVADATVHVIDKESVAVSSFQLAAAPQFVGAPTGDLSGPVRNMLVIDNHAYFPAVRLAGEFPRNQLDGQYDIIQMSLVDGSVRSIPLPEDCQDPRLAEIGGGIVVYAPNSDTAWMLDSTRARFVRVLWSDDLVELRTREVVALRSAPDTPRAPIRYTVVPGAGVFRLSRLGEFGKILDMNLAKVNLSADPAELGAAHDILALLPLRYNGSPIIGVVRRQEGGLTFSHFDANSLSLSWVTDIPDGAIPGSFYAARDGSTFYIDGPTGAVNRLSPKEGSSTSWRVQPGQGKSARILSIDLGR